MQSPDNMTRAELLRAIDRTDQVHSATCAEMIADGLGYERPSETREKTDELSVRLIAALDRCAALGNERHQRMQWQGNEHRIKRTA